MFVCVHAYLPLSVGHEVVEDDTVGEAGDVELVPVVGPRPELEMALLDVIRVHACNKLPHGGATCLQCTMDKSTWSGRM